MDYLVSKDVLVLLSVISGIIVAVSIAINRNKLKAATLRESDLVIQLAQSQQATQEIAQQLTNAREQKLVTDTLVEANNAANAREVSDLGARLEEQDHSLHQRQSIIADQIAQIATLKTRLQEQGIASSAKLDEFQQAKQQLNKDFEILANRIFDEKTDRFNKNSKVSLENVLNPLREQLSDFKKKVEDVYDKDNKDRISLVAELGQLKQLNQKMTDEALNLTKALKGDNKAQGNWGEVILERVLEESGLHKGREYDTQVSLKTDQGNRRNPDVVVRLPENKDIIIDSKVSLVHYERFCNTEDELVRQQALKDHISSIRAHINGLSFKDYENLEGINTLDFVFIFIPIESAFMTAFEHDQAMFKDAYEKNIIVVSPTTLLATLRTVQSIWRYERQNKNSEEIARQAGAMHDKFVAFVTDLDKISEHLEKANTAHDNAMNKLITGKGNLVGSTQRLEKLGAKTKKKIPANLLADSEISNEEEENNADPLLKLSEEEKMESFD